MADDGAKKLTRKDIATTLAKELGSARRAAEFREFFFDTLAEMVCKHKRVSIHGFGVFRVLDKSARMGRNPKTKEAFPISTRRVVSFVSGKKMKRIVKD